ncbi:hypothetical protein [Tabrizicola sp.]|uniref:hypothetical protein n=1 Tax=Tabrizicola sp. TaxID=2005166 RepID=UPI0027337B46|nr:hypothetical protein [Tabrizicola sp.]MDP3196084.1 hypothetical protein [Tabrizicola sp.]
MRLAEKPATTSGPARRLALLPVLAFGLSGCASGEFFEDVQRYSGPDSVIAKASDSGADDDPGLIDGEAAIAYDPDGCQVWIIDDGVEGYSSPRFDPATGLPICDGKYPPGTVLGPYETSTAPGPDYVPR